MEVQKGAVHVGLGMAARGEIWASNTSETHEPN